MDAIIDITGQHIETPRLILRPWRESDLADFNHYASVEGVGEMAGWPHHTSLEESKRILDIFIEGKCTLALEHRGDGRVIGSVGLHRSWFCDTEVGASLRVKEIGYAMAKDYWGWGLMPEAVNVVIAHCFEKDNLDAVTCEHFVENNQSRRVIEKCGFSYIQRGVFEATQMDKLFDTLRYVRYRT